MTELQSSPTIAGEPRAPVRANLASSSPTNAIQDRNLAKHCTNRDRRSALRVVIDASRDRTVDRDLLAFARSRRLVQRRCGRRTGAREAPHRRT